MLFNVPEERGSYDSAVVAFVDYRQISFSFNGEGGRVHRQRLAPGEHHFTFTSPPLASGIHRLAIVFFDDDEQPGFAGEYELLADVYVGRQPVPAVLGEPQRYTARSDPAIAAASYRAYVTVTPDRLQLAGNLSWSASLRLWANIVGSVSSAEQVAAVTAIQDFEQAAWIGGMQLVRTAAGQLVTLPLTPQRPVRASEQLRVLVFTEPLREIAPQGVYDSAHDFRLVSSQKVFIRSP